MVAHPPSQQALRSGLKRFRCKALKDGAIGWATVWALSARVDAQSGGPFMESIFLGGSRLHSLLDDHCLGDMLGSFCLYLHSSLVKVKSSKIRGLGGTS